MVAESLFRITGISFAVVLLVVRLAMPYAQATHCGPVISEPDQQVQASAGQAFGVSLESQPGTGYSWSIAEQPDASVAEPVLNVLLPAAVARPGAAQMQCFVFNALADGQTSIRFQYARPFAPDAEPARVQDVQVVVASWPPPAAPDDEPPMD